jgi:hypothetical protein
LVLGDGPLGEVLVGPCFDEETILSAELDLDEIAPTTRWMAWSPAAVAIRSTSGPGTSRAPSK